MLRVNRSLRKTIRKAPYHLTMDQAFAQVIDACAYTLRPTQQGTWITSKMREAYKTLHQLGLAHSVEVWQAEKLVGGLYGVSLGGFFAGESMFSHADNASKIAFVTLVNQLHRKGIYLLDCQVYTELLAQFGAIEWPRVYFLHELHKCIKKPTDQGKWQLDDDLQHGRANCNIPKIAVET
jgi:leucyl/phenylalanyl-tRNA--protein transferase